MPPVERLSTLADSGKSATEYDEIIAQVSERRAWDDNDLAQMQKIFKSKKGHSQKETITILEWWSRPEEFGEVYLKALQSYYQEFFAEEERRIKSALQRSIEQALELAYPTRLKIIRYLSQEPLSPAQLTRRLRLRPPTVGHHLEGLRLAGLVKLNLEVPGERKYATRIEGLEDTFANIKEFLQTDLNL